MEQFDTYFRPKLAALGYEGLFEPKSRVRTMDCMNMIKRVDGCAIFYKQNKFRLVERHLLEFRRIAVANANGNQPMINRVMTKDNIGLATILELIPAEKPQQNQYIARKSQKHTPQASNIRETTPATEKRQQILVCNTHIHWNPEDCDVKLMQTIMLMDELGSIARQHLAASENQSTSTSRSSSPRTSEDEAEEEEEENELMPLILLGDFNSMPNSGVTDYLINGEISSLHKDFKDYRYSAIGSSINQLTARRQSSPAWCNYSPSPTTNTAQSHLSPPPTPTIVTKINNTSKTNPKLLTQTSSTQNHRFTTTTTGISSFPILSTDSTTTLLSSSSTSTSSVDSACYSTSSSPVPVLNYSHPFRLASAYEKNIVPFTNYTQQFKAIIDYIFYSNESLQLLGLLGPLDKNWLKANQIRTLPQPHVPSDHLPLLVKFRLNQPSSSNSRLDDDDERPFIMNSGDLLRDESPPALLMNFPPTPLMMNRFKRRTTSSSSSSSSSSSMRHTNNLPPLGRLAKPQESFAVGPCVGGDSKPIMNYHLQHKLQPQQQQHRQSKGKWVQHPRLTRTTSYSPSSSSLKNNQK